MKRALALICVMFMIMITTALTAKEGLSQGPITEDGGISAGWALVTSFTIIGALLVFIIKNMSNQFTTAIKHLQGQIDGHSERHKDNFKKHEEFVRHINANATEIKLHDIRIKALESK